MNAIAVRNDPKAMVDFTNEMGEHIARSGMFGCENDSQGHVIALACVMKSMDPMTLAESYDIIGGKLSMKSSAMLAEFNTMGGKHKIIQRDGEGASVELSYDGQSVTFSLTWEEAQRETFVYNGKEADVLKALAEDKTQWLQNKMKPKYRQPRSRTQMLWARVISDGVRALAPGVNSGIYTPEEVSDFTGTEAVEATSQADQAESTTPMVSPADVEELADGDQLSEITALFNQLKVPGDKQLAAIQKRGASDIASLSKDGAADLLAGLRKKASQIEVASVDATSEHPAGAVKAPSNGPADQTTIDRIKKRMEELAQRPGGAESVQKIIAKIKQVGKLSDFSQPEAVLLMNAIETKNLELFFDAELKGQEVPF